MSSIRTPTGPLPKSVYWRRRAVLLLVLVAIIAIIAIIAWPRGGGTTPAPTGTSPSGTPAAEAGSETGAPVDGEACDPTKVDVTAETDAASYDPGVNPQLWLTITSRQTTECVIPAGTDVQEYRITSGDELIWSSRDCQTDPVPFEQVLTPGVPVEAPHITWDRTRSSPDTCGTEREPVVADGASYHLEVIVGDLESTSTKQFLLY